MSNELWKPVPGYDAHYEVSSHGRVRRVGSPAYGRRKSAILTANTKDGRYPQVGLCVGGVRTVHRVHALVALAFLGERPGGMHVNHKDGNKNNNAVANLEYVTPAENVAHAVATGLTTPPPIRAGEDAGNAKLDWETVRWIRQRRKAGDPYVVIAAQTCVSRANVAAICEGRTWRDDPGSC